MITANDLKVKGVKAIEEGLKDSEEVSISVRGKVKYIAMTVEQYDEMRASEILVAYQDVLIDIKNDNFTDETAEEHVLRLWPEQ